MEAFHLALLKHHRFSENDRLRANALHNSNELVAISIIIARLIATGASDLLFNERLEFLSEQCTLGPNLNHVSHNHLARWLCDTSVLVRTSSKFGALKLALLVIIHDELADIFYLLRPGIAF